MMCDDVFQAALEAVVRDLSVTEERHCVRPAEFDRAALRADVHRVLVRPSGCATSPPIPARPIFNCTSASTLPVLSAESDS